MKYSTLLSVFLSTLPTLESSAKPSLYGTWRLVSLTQTATATGEATDVFGKAPRGFITYGRDGRMMTLIVTDSRPKPANLAAVTDQQRADLFRTMVAYGGAYTFDGKVVTHHVDISSNETWTGTDQVRNVKFERNLLILTTNPQASPPDGRMAVTVLTWERLK